ncbi:MAG: copper ion binding protein, partial [Erythrobacter sp.]|nr:copper ion binding protein [Erythrobacter sp.]
MNAPPRLSTPITLTIEGMTCASCVGRVERALRAVPGVLEANVNLATERADVRFEGAPNRTALVKAIEDVGYDIPASSVELAVEGMTCASCVGRVERTLMAVPGVTEANVNLATERATVRGTADAASLIAAIDDVGYEARELKDRSAADETASEKREAEARGLRRSVLIAALLTLPVFILEMGSHVIPGMHQFVMDTIGMRASWMIQFLLTTLVLIGPGRQFYTKGFPALFKGAPDMNSLVAVGTTAAYL